MHIYRRYCDDLTDDMVVNDLMHEMLTIADPGEAVAESFWLIRVAVMGRMDQKVQGGAARAIIGEMTEREALGA